MAEHDLKRLCVELQCRGVRIQAAPAGRSDGAGPAEGRTIIVGGRYLNVPTSSWYVDFSHCHIDMHEGAWRLFKDKDYVCEVFFPPQPGFYDQVTPSGLPFKQLALLHGSDCFASTVHQDCTYWNTPLQCRFCGIGLSLQNKSTILIKDPADLALAAAFAERHDKARHVTLTTGAWHDEARGLEHLAACIKAIKKSTAMPVHVQVHPPQDLRDFDVLKAAGADTLGIHIETCDAALLADMAPGKAELGFDTYKACWERGVCLFGANQVSSFLLAGLGETARQLLEMVERIARLGVVPYVLPLRPIPGSLLADRKPPEPSYMADMYAETARIMKNNNLASVKSAAGCVRCGACSCLSLYEEDPSL